jgi:hypothetical protein
MKCRIIGQNCGVILICDWIAATLATASNRRKVPKQPDGHAVEWQQKKRKLMTHKVGIRRENKKKGCD